MTDHDLGIGQQRGEPLRIAFILEDLRFQTRFDLGKDARRNACGELAEKQSFHLELFPFMFPGAHGDRKALRAKHNGRRL